MNYDSIVVLDFETTGLEATAQPVEVAWLEITEDLVKVGEVASLVKPSTPIEPSAMAVHGITEEMVATAPSLIEVLLPLTQKQKVLCVAHNASFDIRFLRPAVNADILCTKRLSWELLPGLPNNKLSEIASALELESAPTHRALADVETCLSLLKYFKNEKGLSLEQMKEISDTAVASMKMPFGKHKGMQVKDLPSSYVDWMRREMTLNGDLLEAINLRSLVGSKS